MIQWAAISALFITVCLNAAAAQKMPESWLVDASGWMVLAWFAVVFCGQLRQWRELEWLRACKPTRKEFEDLERRAVQVEGKAAKMEAEQHQRRANDARWSQLVEGQRETIRQLRLQLEAEYSKSRARTHLEAVASALGEPVSDETVDPAAPVLGAGSYGFEDFDSVEVITHHEEPIELRVSLPDFDKLAADMGYSYGMQPGTDTDEGVR